MHDVVIGLEVLLDGPYATLWDHCSKRETLRFLRKRGGDLSRKELSRLIRAILAGPPKKGRAPRGRKAIHDAKVRMDHEIRQRLHKLIEAGVHLPRYAQREYDRIQKELPWDPPKNRQDEFALFTSSGWRDLDSDGSVEDFGSMDKDTFVDWASNQTGDPWNCGGGWNQFAKADPSNALALLEFAASKSLWPIPPWHAFIASQLSADERDKNFDRRVADNLMSIPAEELSKLDLQGASWLEKARAGLPKRLRQTLFRKLWDATSAAGEPKGDLDFDMTLNHAGGVLGHVLYSEMASYIPRVGPGDNPGLPKNLRSAFEAFDADDPAAKLARVRVAPMLFLLFRIDPAWTARVLLSRMDVEEPERFDPYLWEGFLWSPRLSEDLFPILKPYFLKMLQDVGKIPERVRDNAAQLFIQMAIPPDRGVTVEEARGVLFSFSTDLLARAAVSLRSIVEAAGAKSPALWTETVGPWFEHAWPKRPQDRSPELSSRLAWLAIDSGDAFPDVVKSINGVLTEEKYEDALFHLAKAEQDGGLVSRHPEAALTLVDRLVGAASGRVTDSLKNVLEAIGTADLNLKTSPTFQRLQVMV